jgi:hypothetical protein
MPGIKMRKKHLFDQIIQGGKEYSPNKHAISLNAEVYYLYRTMQHMSMPT